MEHEVQNLRKGDEFNYQVHLGNLRAMKFVALACLLISIASAFSAIFYFTINRHLEYLLIGINNVVISFACIFAIYWSMSSIENSSHHYAYIHQNLTQITCALEVGLLICLLQYGSFNECLWLIPLQVIIIVMLLYLIYYGRLAHSGVFGIFRSLVYSSTIMSGLFLIFAAYNLKKLILQINAQMITLSEHNIAITFIKVVLILVIIVLVLLLLITTRRVKIYFILASFLVLTVMIITSTANGKLIRQTQALHYNLNLSSGCRDGMQSIGEESLKSELECSVKYLHQDEAPYLSCGQDEQTYQWENKSYQLGCINKDCCNKVKKWLSTPLNDLTIWVNLIIALGIIQAINSAMLQELSYDSQRVNFLKDAVMLGLLLIIVIIIITVFIITPPPPVQIQNVIVKEREILNGIKIVPTPNYSQFQTQQRLTGFFNLQNCDLAMHFILTKINYDAPNEMSKRDILVAIQADEGQFIVTNNYNEKDIKFITDSETVHKLFPVALPEGVKADYFIVQGPQADIQKLLNTGLNICSERALQINFVVLQQFVGKSQNRLLAIADQAQTQVDRLLKYLDVSGLVEDSEEFTKINGANAFIYQGGFQLTSCQVITTLQDHYLQAQSNEKGEIKFHNLSQGILYTILVKKEGYKNSCALVNLASASPKIEYHIRLSPQVDKHSMKIQLEWTSTTLNLDLYGMFQIHEHQCITGAISKGCGGMHTHSKNQGGQHIEILYIDEIEPQKYTFFVKRFLERKEALELIGTERINQVWIEADPIVTVYVPEIDYPLIQYRLLTFPSSLINAIDLTWLVFSIDGSIGDGPIMVEGYKNYITNEEIVNKESAKKNYWPQL